jgi:hypothetical protein
MDDVSAHILLANNYSPANPGKTGFWKIYSAAVRCVRNY